MRQEEVPWFERWPDLAAWELGRFDAHGLLVHPDAEAKAEGRFVLHSTVDFGDQTIELEIRYPAETPELPPQVFAKPGLLERHQNPFSGNFCLLERPLDDWLAGSWGAADLIVERLKSLLKDAAAGSEAIRLSEAPIPEPFTAFYDYPLGPVVLLPAELSQPAGEAGSIHLRSLDGFVRFVVESVDSMSAGDSIVELFPQMPFINGRWIRVPSPPHAHTGSDLAQWARKNHLGLLRNRVPKKLVGKKHLSIPPLQVVAFVFEEEGPGVGELRPGWLFLCVPREDPPFLAHCQLVSVSERFRRTPELLGLAETRAALVGLGTLGGEIAVGLAKAGVGHLDLIDDDRFEINNTARHVLGIESSGLPKTSAVGHACRRANPFCTAYEHLMTFGETEWKGPSSIERLRRILEGADVVVETTGSYQLQRFVARIAQETGTPLVASGLTDGFWGGECLRILPGSTSCYVCFATDKANGRIPEAPASPVGPVVVQGCSHPTVTGAGFDASGVAAFTTRLTVQTILRGDGYPDAEWDYAVLSYRDSEGQSVPAVQTKRLPPREDCDRCRHVVGSRNQH